MNAPSVRTGRRKFTVLLVATVTIALAGYVTGTARRPERSGYAPAASSVRPLGLAPRQADVSSVRYAARNAEIAASFARLGEGARDAQGMLVLTPTEREAARISRVANRAYEGAPPTVPHAVDTRGLPACLVCHERGMRVNGRVAPAMRHEARSSCLQCHAPPPGRTPDPARPHGPIGWPGGTP